MASNYFPVSLLEQPWDDDQLGTLSSLERRQRKAAEKQDVNAFYKFLGVVFVSFSLVLLGSELYTFATEPSRGLTGAFLMEIGRMSGVAYGQMLNLYKAVGDVAWTGIAVVHGHDFAQRGVSITDGAAQLLASGLYYLALALSVLVMYYAYPGVTRAPLRTSALSTLAAGALFGAPPLYAWLVSRLCQTRSPEPVVLVALLFAAAMIWASLSAARAISGLPGGDGPHGSSTSRHRNVTVSRRQAAAGAGAGGAAAAAAAATGGASGGGGSTASAAGGQKRSSYSRASSSSGRSGGAAAQLDPTQPSVARSGSSASLSGPGGLLGGFNCLSGPGGASSMGADPVGIHASARGLHTAAGSCGSSSLDLLASSSSAAPPCTSGKAGASAGPGRVGPTGHSNSSSTFDPTAPNAKLGGNGTPRGAGGGGPGGVGHSSGTGSGGAAAAAAAKTSTNSSSKQRQQDGGKAKQATGSGPGSNASRGPVPDPVSSGGAGGGSKSSTARQQQQHSDPVAPPPASSVTAAAPLSSSSATAATAIANTAAKKKASNNASNSSSTAPAASTAVNPVAATAASASVRQQQQQQQGPASVVMPGTAAAAAAAAAASKSSRPESAAAQKPSGGGAAGTASTGSSSGPALQSKSTPPAATSVAAGAAAAIATAGGAASAASGLLSRLAGSVAAAASTAAPALTSRSAKKTPPAPAPRKPPPQYVIVPPPPPPPPRKPPPADPTAVMGGGGAAAAGAADAAAAAGNAAVRNAWLNPNPVIKIASGVAKVPKGSATSSGRTSATNLTAAAPAATAPVSRSGGGAATHYGSASPPTPSSARSASYGGAGVTPADPPVFDGYVSSGSTHAYPRSALFADATATIAPASAAQPPPVGGAVGNRVVTPADVVPPPPLPVSAIVPHLTQFQETAIGGVATAAAAVGQSYITTTIVSADASMGPLVAHKHASGDLDIANVAANYRPYPSSAPPPPPASAVQPPPAADGESADSFSLFSTPPPLITAEALVDPSVAAATACLAGADGDAAAPRVAHMLYGMYGGGGGGGGYGNYAALPSLSGDPVWSHNVPSVFGTPAAAGGARAPRVPPPGFPSHAYGGAFAAGPIPAGGGWEQVAAATATAVTTAGAAAANGRSDTVPPLPPAGGNGVLASLGFVDDGGGADSSGSPSASAGGGEDAGASCAICWSAPRQVGFLHGKTSHLCVCRRCAAKLREGVHRCPMCRQLIERIIDIY